MSVTVVIPHYGDDAVLAPCLASLDLHAPHFGLVVHDANETGANFATACNSGATVASGEWLLFLNNDCRVTEGWADAMVLAAADHRDQVIGCKLVYPHGGVQHAGVQVLRGPGVAWAQNVTREGPSAEADAVTGACLMVRRELFLELAGFDDQFDNGYEDVDFCLRATRHTGRRAWVEMTATAVHLESQSGAARWRSVQHNVGRLNEKWGL